MSKSDAVTNELLYKTLQKLQHDVTNIRQAVRNLDNTVNALARDVNALRADMIRHDERVASVEVRQDTVDDRMELRDA